MEGLIIFIIFIVFSLLRSLGGQGQQQRPGQGPMGPRPIRPVRPVRPLPPGRYPENWPPEYDGLPFFAEEPRREEEADVDVYRGAAAAPKIDTKPRQKAKSPEVVKAPRQEGYDSAYGFVADAEGPLPLDGDAVVLGVIFSEVLGSPRYKKPWRPRP